MDYQDFINKNQITYKNSPFILRDYQVKILEKIDISNLLYIKKARQLGISTIMAFYAYVHSLNTADNGIGFVPWRMAAGRDVRDTILDFSMRGIKYSSVDNPIVFSNKSTIKIGCAAHQFAGYKLKTWIYDETSPLKLNYKGINAEKTVVCLTPGIQAEKDWGDHYNEELWGILTVDTNGNIKFEQAGNEEVRKLRRRKEEFIDTLINQATGGTAN
jgi:hypothetical protein